jgi:hypothetical protein
VLAFYSVGHLQERSLFYAELRRVLKQGGIFIVTVDGMWFNLTKKVSHSKILDLILILRRQGFDKINFERVDGEIFPVLVHHFTPSQLHRELKADGFEIVDTFGAAIPLSFVPYSLLKQFQRNGFLDKLIGSTFFMKIDAAVRRNPFFQVFSKHITCVAVKN